MSPDTPTPEPPDELWGLWKGRLGLWDDRFFETEEDAEDDAGDFEDESKVVVCLIGVHPSWRERAEKAKAELAEVRRKTVLEAAKVCDQRAASHHDHQSFTAQNEATKCGMAIRHALLCVQGQEEICLRCEGEGCDKCGGRGIRALKKESPDA